MILKKSRESVSVLPSTEKEPQNFCFFKGPLSILGQIFQEFLSLHFHSTLWDNAQAEQRKTTKPNKLKKELQTTDTVLYSFYSKHDSNIFL